MSNNSKKGFYLVSSTEGCTTNLYESSSYEKYMVDLGIERVASPGDAEYIILNTCGYNEGMQSKSSEMIQDMQNKFGKDKKIVVGGCYPAMDKAKFNKNLKLPNFMPGDTAGLHDKLNLPHARPSQEEIANESIHFDVVEKANLTLMHKLIFNIRKSYFGFENTIGRKFQPLHNLIDTALVNEAYTPILTGVGCLGKCTFCAIKMAKGKIKSRPLELLKSVFDDHLSKGKSKLWLLGDDIGCWGQDLNLDSSQLLKSFLDSPYYFQLVVTYYDPEWLIRYHEELKSVFADKRIVSINFPIQSGSDRVIEDMQRTYSVESVLEKVKEIKKSNPALGVKTNFIVGFPGETWGDFYKSLKALFYFDAAFVNRYGRVSNTLAAKREDQVNRFVKDLRFYILTIASNFRHAFVAIRSFFNISKIQRSK
jgi:ribosomal protein S12 methylthiotransferase